MDEIKILSIIFPLVKCGRILNPPSVYGVCHERVYASIPSSPVKGGIILLYKWCITVMQKWELIYNWAYTYTQCLIEVYGAVGWITLFFGKGYPITAYKARDFRQIIYMYYYCDDSMVFLATVSYIIFLH